jgi:hypothetical protein
MCIQFMVCQLSKFHTSRLNVPPLIAVISNYKKQYIPPCCHFTINNDCHHNNWIFCIHFYHTAVPSRSCSKAVYKPVWHIPLPSVQWINSWWWTDELSETCRVSWENKFVKLVHLVGFITKKVAPVLILFQKLAHPLSCYFCLREIKKIMTFIGF